jgi:hypothetical protein
MLDNSLADPDLRAFQREIANTVEADFYSYLQDFKSMEYPLT